MKIQINIQCITKTNVYKVTELRCHLSMCYLLGRIMVHRGSFREYQREHQYSFMLGVLNL